MNKVRLHLRCFMPVANKTLQLAAAIVFCLMSAHAQEQQHPWYKTSVIYSLDIATFKDSDGDGKGDIQGLIQQLPYLEDLGINVIWLSPFFPSPGKDDGYDISDYYNIDPHLGTINELVQFINQAHEHKIKVIVDLILNHTSDQHPWFQKSRNNDSAFLPWYVWSVRRPKDANKGMVFPGVQTETWSLDTMANAFYFHRFYRFQPDLNFTNINVQKEAFSIIDYWLKLGLDGYRLDAVPFIIDIPETSINHPERMLWLIGAMAKEVHRLNKNAILLGEANLSPKENADYFDQNGDGLDMMFNFYVNQYLFYSLAAQNTKPFIKALEATRKKPLNAQWAFFLRNHDEIDLERLSKRQRKKVYNEFGPDTSMQLYKRGIRRRLAPMLANDQKRIKMAYSILFSLPGTPVIRYGEELGMGDDLTLKERLSVRTPMQWLAGKNGGFSDSDTPFRKLISDTLYGYGKVNVNQELSDTASLLNYVKRLILLRKQYPEIGYADFKILKTKPAIFAILYSHGNTRLLLIQNLSKNITTFQFGDISAPSVLNLIMFT